MKNDERFSWKKRGMSFVYAFQGLRWLLRYEHNARIHMAAALAVIAAGIFFGIVAWEWCVLMLCIGMVVSAEALNSAVEAIADKVSPEYNELIGRAKDFGALAVMWLAFVAVIVGGVVFIPYIIRML